LRILLVLLLVPTALHAQYSRERAALVLRGEAALQRQEIRVAIDAFREAARDTNAARRAAAERMLGIIAWRFYRQDGEARVHFGTALATQRDTSATLVEMARLANVEARYKQAYELASRARRSASDDIARRAATLQMGRAISDAALAERLGEAPAATPMDTTSASAAVEALRELVRRTPGRVEEAHQLLLDALVAGDGKSAAAAIDSYYLIEVAGSGSRSPIKSVVAELDAVLPAWRGDATPRPVRTRIAGELTRARLFDAAALVAPLGSEVLQYAKYCRQIEREAIEYYRRTLVEGAQAQELTRLYIHALHDLWPHLAWKGAPPPFYPAAADAELGRRFGALIQLGITGGYYDMHMGHVISEEPRSVTQYGKSARVTFLVIDGIVTNGLQSWAWDDAGGHGGWQRRDTIVQVRPIFVEHALSLWVSADSARREHERRSIANDSIVDFVVARSDSVAYMPGVAGRLRRDGRNAIIDSLRRAGVTDSALGRVFVGVVSRLIRESSIVAHEGRHAIDDGIFPALSPEEREFRAKLSEVGFADHPKIVMSSIVHPNIGDATPHGRANARVMLGLIHWMRLHASEIAGFDGRQPVLIQLPLLTDAQLRRAFRSMDPMARAN
jgi:hypothetical protein